MPLPTKKAVTIIVVINVIVIILIIIGFWRWSKYTA